MLYIEASYPARLAWRPARENKKTDTTRPELKFCQKRPPTRRTLLGALRGKVDFVAQGMAHCKRDSYHIESLSLVAVHFKVRVVAGPVYLNDGIALLMPACLDDPSIEATSAPKATSIRIS